MDCPSCRQAMTRRTLDGRYGRRVEIDVCHGCAALWFDGDESLVLTPEAVLELFVLIHDERAAARNPLASSLACHHCRQALTRTADLQRTTRFGYWRCPREHGRFITFVDFLREKNFVRPLDPRELEKLQRNVRTMTCSSCGAPIALDRDSACPYCRAPIAMLDAAQVQRVVDEIRRTRADRAQTEVDRRVAAATLPLKLRADRAHVDRVFAEIGRDPDWSQVRDSFSLVEAALGALAGLIER